MQHFFLTIIDGLKKINYILNKEQKRYSVIILFLSLVGALLETLGVGIIIPFVQVFMNKDLNRNNIIVRKVFGLLNNSDGNQLFFYMLLILILIFIAKNIYFLFLSWIRIKYSNKIEREFSVKILKSCLKKGYLYFSKNSNAEIMKLIGTDTLGTNLLIFNCLKAVSDILVMLFIGLFILFTDWIIAVGILLMAVISIVIVYGYFRKMMRTAGDEYNKYCTECNQYMLQAIIGIKETLVAKKERFIISQYESATIKKQNQYVQQIKGWEWPAYIIEAVCVTGLLATLGIRVYLVQDGIETLFPALSAFAVGAFRILPSLGRISATLNATVYYTVSLNNVYNHLVGNVDLSNEEFDKGEKIVTFNKSIEIEKISWQYDRKNAFVLKDLSLVIPKGETIGIVGKSGAGKTTLVDILLGLFKPLYGTVHIDGKDVFDDSYDFSLIRGYVPQNSFYLSDSIRRNVAYGIPDEEIVDERVWKSLEKAQIKEFIENLPEGIYTYVSDYGVNFSGGQRQRIAIARALYNNPDILVFDEATAALDNETEMAVMDAIDALHGEKTIIIIAHRLTTVKNCDKIYEINDGKAYEKTYDEIVSPSKDM